SAQKRLYECHAGPAHVSGGGANQKERRQCWSQKDSMGIGLIHEVGLAHAAVAYRVILLGVKQCIAKYLRPGNVILPSTHQVCVDGHGVVVDKCSTLQSNLVAVALCKAQGLPLRVGIHHCVEDGVSVDERSCKCRLARW